MKKLLLTSALTVLSLSEAYAEINYVRWLRTPDINNGIMDWCQSDESGNCKSKGNFGRLMLPGAQNKIDISPPTTLTFEYKGKGPTTLCKGVYKFEDGQSPSGIWDVKVSGINEKDQCNVVITPAGKK